MRSLRWPVCAILRRRLSAPVVGLALSAVFAAHPAARGAFTDLTPARLPVVMLTAYRVLAADVDGDGDQDLLLACAGQNRLFRNQGAGAFVEAASGALPSLAGTTTDAVFTDADGDGDADLVLAVFQGRNRLLLNDGTGTFTDASAARLPDTTALAVALAAGDVDGDGDPDLVAACRGDVCRVYVNQAGTFSDQTPSRLPGAAAAHSSVALLDADGDGDLDLFAGVERGQCRLWRNRGTGVFTETTATDLPQGTRITQHAAVLDADGDGDLDLILAEDGDGLRLLLNDGSGHFSDASAGRLPALDTSCTQAVPVDTDVDGDLDLVVSGLGQNALLLNDGTGHFTDATAALLPADTERTFGVAAVDVDHDLDPDLVLARPQAQPRLWVNAMAEPRVRLTVTPTAVEVGSPATITVQAADEDGIASIEATVNGVPVALTAGTAQYVPAAPGAYTVQASARDTLGNPSAVRRASFTAVANLVPVVSAGPNATLFRGGTYAATGSFTDTGAGPWTGTVNYGTGAGAEPLALAPDKTFALSHAYPDYGTYTVTVAVSDGLGTGTDTVLVAVVNQPPVLAAIPSQVVQDPVAFIPVALDAYVADPDHADAEIAWAVAGNTVLQVTVDASRVARLTYTPGTRVTETLTFTATDPLGGTASAHADFTVAEPSGDVLRPYVTVTATPAAVGVNVPVTLSVTVTDASPILSRTLVVNGTPMLLDGAGQSVFSSPTPGVFTAVATAMDNAGNQGHAETEFRVLVPGDTTPPTVAIAAPDELGEITAAVDIRGTASDPNLMRYTLAYAPVGGTPVVPFASGTATVDDGVLGELDATTLANGMVSVRLTAEDTSGNTATATRVFRLSGQRKVGPVRLSFTDLHLPVAGTDINIVRSYDSQDKRQGDFGVGWSLGFNSFELFVNDLPATDWFMSQEGGGFTVYRITETVPHVVTVRFPNGTVDAFGMRLAPTSNLLNPVWDLTVSYVPLTPGVTSTLAAVGDDLVQPLDGPGDITLWTWGFGRLFDPERYRLTTVDGTVITLRKNGTMESLRDLDGNTLTITAAGVTHSAGRSALFTRDAAGRITVVTDPKGNRITYTYDAYGDLVAVTDQIGGITRFVYDSAHDLVDMIGPSGSRDMHNLYDDDGRLIASTSPTGDSTTYDRDLDARRETVRDALGGETRYVYDEGGRVTSLTDPLGRTTTAAYDAAGRIVSETDPLGNTGRWAYDGAGNLASTTLPSGNMLSSTYDSQGRRLSTTDPMGQTTTFGYDAAGHLASRTDPLGHTTQWTYDARGNLLTETDPLGNTSRHEYNAVGDRLRTVSPLGQEAVFSYDANGNQTAISYSRTDAAGTPVAMSVAMVYDGLNRLTSRTDEAGATYSYEYSAGGHLGRIVGPDGRPLSELLPRAGRTVSTSLADGSVLARTSNEVGLLASRTDPAGRTTAYEYDAAGQLTKVIQPGGPTAVLAYDNGGRISRLTDERGTTYDLTHDAMGALTEVRGPDGAVTQSSYDPMLRPTRATDGLGRSTQVDYDPVGRPTRTVFADGSQHSVTYDAAGRVTAKTDPAGNATGYAYDALGRLVTVTDAAGGVTTYGYDDVGNLTAVTDAVGKTLRMEYGSNYRLLRRVLPLGMAESWAYNTRGQALSYTDFAGRTTGFTYDDAGRLASIAFSDGSSVQYTYSATGRVSTVADAGGTTTCVYDGADRLLSETRPDGTVVSYTYDAAGLLTSVTSPAGTVAYAQDALGRLASVTAPDGQVTRYTRDVVGNVTAVAYPNGVVRTATYDPCNRPTVLSYADAGGTVLASFTYTYDVRGNMSRVVENTGRQVDYLYDVLSRLTEERITAPGGGVHTIGYTYDAVGNRLTRALDGVATPYAYDDNHRLVSVGAARYTYDANGNLTQADSGTGRVTTYTYDARNRLSAARIQEGATLHTVEYALDRSDRVLRTVDGTEVRRFLIDRNARASQVLQETDADGNRLARYVRGTDLLSLEGVAGKRYCHADATRSVRLLTDASGRVTDTATTDAFGSPLAQTGSTPSPYGFAGERLDELTSLYHLRARDYDPVAGRFVARDPAAPDPLRPATFHPYLYTENSPLTRWDPSGRDWNLTSTMLVCATIASLSRMNYLAIVGDFHPFSHGVAYDGINDGRKDDHHLEARFNGEWWQMASGFSISGGDMAVGHQAVISRVADNGIAAVAVRHLTLDFSFNLLDALKDEWATGIATNSGMTAIAYTFSSVISNPHIEYSQETSIATEGVLLSVAAVNGLALNPSAGASASFGVGHVWGAYQSGTLDGLSIGAGGSLGVNDPIGAVVSIGFGVGLSYALGLNAPPVPSWNGLGLWNGSVGITGAASATISAGVSPSAPVAAGISVTLSNAFRSPRFPSK